jgi:putative ABC transport system permease protein
MAQLIQDVRFSLRQLRRSPGFTGAVILTLAVGLGLNAAIFTMVDCVLLRPLAYRDAARIYSLNTRFVQEGRSIPRMGGGDYVDVARDVKSLENVAYYGSGQDGVQLETRSLYLNVANVSPTFGQVMGVEPLAGRLFHDETDGREAMVSSAFAREWYGSTAAAVGRTLRYQGKPRLIAGVMPDGFSFPGKTAVWMEEPAVPDVLNRTAYNQRVIGKARPGVSAAVLNAEVGAFSKQLAAQYPEDKLKALEAVPLQEQIVGKIRPMLQLLMGSVFVVLLIVIANVTHLQMVRAMTQRREVSIRLALGASRSKLAWRAVTESVLLAVMGCAAGVLLAIPALRVMVRLAPADIPRLADVRLNLHVVTFSFLLSLMTMIVAAVLPIWRSWRVDPGSTMKEDSSRGTEGRRAGKLRDGLIVGEVALTLMLGVVALLLARQLIQQSREDLGFSPQRLLVLDTHSTVEYGAEDSGAAGVAALDALLDSVRGVVGVDSVAAVSGAPIAGSISDVSYAVRGKSEFKPGVVLPNANIAPVTQGYFETMKIPLLRGRGLTAADRAGSEPVLVVSKSMATQIFGDADPIGRQIMCGFDSSLSWWTIVGVVGDVRQDSPASTPYPTFYVPIAQHPRVAGDVEVVVRTRSGAVGTAKTVEDKLRQQYPAVAVVATTMMENVDESERAQHFRTMLFAGFAGVSILLALVGMYGVTSYAVTERRFEFALRFALGADRGQVLRIVLREALIVAAIGVCLGVAMSLSLMRVTGILLGKMPEFDLLSYLTAAVAVLLAMLGATLIPAFRAAHVDPMQVLRSE